MVVKNETIFCIYSFIVLKILSKSAWKIKQIYFNTLKIYHFNTLTYKSDEVNKKTAHSYDFIWTVLVLFLVMETVQGSCQV